MIKFKDLGIIATLKPFSGEKIKINKVLNKEIIVHEFRIVDSQFKGKRLDMQISVGNIYHLLWTGSTVLQDMILRVPKESFPFSTTIIEQNESLEFT